MGTGVDGAGETKMGAIMLQLQGQLVSPEQSRLVYFVTNQNQGRLL